MAITVTCKCGKSHQVKDQFAGHETNCPYCGKPLTIPNIEKAREVLTSPPSVVAPPSLEKEEMVKPPVFQDIQPETLSSAEEEQAAVPTPEPQQPVEPSAPEQQEAKFVSAEDKEICTYCGRQMPSSEQACVFEGNIVCAQCDNKLRSKPNIPIQQQVIASDNSLEKMQKQNNQATTKVSIWGIIVSAFLIFIAFLPKINKLFEESLLEPPSRPTISYNQEVGSFIDTVYLLTWIGTGLILFVRSLLPGLGFLRGCLTVIGAFFACAIFAFVSFMLIAQGLPSSLCTLVGFLTPGFLGVIMLIYGFKPKKGFQKKQRNTQ